MRPFAAPSRSLSDVSRTSSRGGLLGLSVTSGAACFNCLSAFFTKPSAARAAASRAFVSRQ